MSRRVQKSGSGSAEMIGTGVTEDTPPMGGASSGTPLPISSACSKVLIRDRHMEISGSTRQSPGLAASSFLGFFSKI